MRREEGNYYPFMCIYKICKIFLLNNAVYRCTEIIEGIVDIITIIVIIIN